jgi:surface protein
VPAITSAAYDAATGVLVVTGSNIPERSGAANDIDVAKLTLTGSGGGTRVLTSTDVDRDSATQFTITLNSNDKTAVAALLDANGTTAADGTTYNLAAAEDWARGAPSGNTIADLTGNGVTVSNISPPPPPPLDCYLAANVGKVGNSGDCNGMLIVDRTMLTDAIADASYDFKPADGYTSHSGNTYTFKDDTYNIFTGQVANMSMLFQVTGFNENIGYWDVSNVTDMSYMFNNAVTSAKTLVVGTSPRLQQ